MTSEYPPMFVLRSIKLIEILKMSIKVNIDKPFRILKLTSEIYQTINN